MLCRHILFIVKKYYPLMFGIRWLNIFQLGLELKGYEKFTSLFRKIENMEFKSDTNNEQCIFVHEILNTNNIGEYLLCLEQYW